MQNNIQNSVTSNNDLPENHTVLCVSYRQNKLAAAVYYLETYEIHILESSYESKPDFKILNQLWIQIRPAIILISVWSTSDFANVIHNRIANSSNFENISVIRLPVKTFSYSICKDRILNMKFHGELSEATSKETELYLLSIINLSDEHVISVFGALLYFVQTELPKLTHRICHITNILPIKLDNFTWIDQITFKNLHIFDQALHPSGFKWSSKHFEKSSSIYGLIQQFCNKLSSNHLRMLLSSPTCDIDILKQRHEVIRFCNNEKNNQIVTNLRYYIAHLSSLPTFLNSLQYPHIKSKHWKKIYQNIYYAVSIAELCKTNGETVKIFHKIGDMLNDDIYGMVHQINKIIDFEAMDNGETFIVKYGVSQDLDEAKIKYSNLSSIMDAVIPYEFNTVPEYIKKVNMMYMPEVRFILSVPYWEEELTEEELLLPNMDFQFTSGKVAFYKTRRCRELDDLIGDPQIEILQDESGIIQELGHYINNKINIVINLLKEIVELDCIMGMAQFAKENNFIEPKLVNDLIFKVKSGRHPLLEPFSNGSFIPNDIDSQPMKSLIKLIYGPNASGKTVYLYQNALIAYLTHIGSFIPAKFAVIGVMNFIYLRVQTNDSVSLKTSSFLSDLKSLLFLTYNSKCSSFIALDEFGRGTIENNAVPILASCLKYFIKNPEICPHILISTHHYNLLKFFQNEPTVSIHSMNYLFKDDVITFLYKVVDGILSTTYALQIGKYYGLPASLLDIAHRVLLAMRSGENINPISKSRLLRFRYYYDFGERLTQVNFEDINALKGLTEIILTVSKKLF